MIVTILLFCLAGSTFSSSIKYYNPNILESLEDLKELQVIANDDKPSSENIFLGEDLLNSTLIKLSKSLAKKDPLNIDRYNFNVKDWNQINLKGTLENLQIEGFSKFVATSLNLNVLKQTLEFTITLPEVTVSTDYDLDGNIYIFPLYGKGKANLKVKGIELKGTAKVNVAELEIKELEFGYQIEDIKVSISGLLDNEEFSLLASELLSDSAANILNEISSKVSKLLSSTLTDIINNALKGIKDSSEESSGHSSEETVEEETPEEESSGDSTDDVQWIF